VDGVGEPARQHLGALGEQLAAEHLERLGYEIVERNYRTRYGELDIIAFNGRALVFVEVKSRRFGARGGLTLEAVRPHKQRQVKRMAFSWLRERTDRPYAPELRFDAIGVTFDLQGRLVGIEHLEGAF
jgi:putative endonuclease